ncbi:ferredoxin--nadp reductase [Gossypium arboreum]|uniref:Ferredoxin--nadp reductase n=1 Tax=Gossypium arboreum TaxID=29729 RepID=A0A0B0NM38_GOSAR|nr:ferredoxin--nadp reductase [Gossypium arboreum]
MTQKEPVGKWQGGVIELARRSRVRNSWQSKSIYFGNRGRQELVLNLNSDVGGIPHWEANIRGDAKLALNRENHEESKGNP